MNYVMNNYFYDQRTQLKCLQYIIDLWRMIFMHIAIICLIFYILFIYNSNLKLCIMYRFYTSKT